MLKMYFGGISLITKYQDLIPTLNFSTLKKFPEPSEFNKENVKRFSYFSPTTLHFCLPVAVSKSQCYSTGVSSSGPADYHVSAELW